MTLTTSLMQKSAGYVCKVPDSADKMPDMMGELPDNEQEQ